MIKTFVGFLLMMDQVDRIVTHESTGIALKQCASLSRKGKKSPLQRNNIIHLDLPVEAVSTLKGGSDYGFGTIAELRDKESLPRVIIYDFNGKYFLLYGGEIIYACRENKSMVPCVIWSNRLGAKSRIPSGEYIGRKTVRTISDQINIDREYRHDINRLERK